MFKLVQWRLGFYAVWLAAVHVADSSSAEEEQAEALKSQPRCPACLSPTTDSPAPRRERADSEVDRVLAGRIARTQLVWGEGMLAGNLGGAETPNSFSENEEEALEVISASQAHRNKRFSQRRPGGAETQSMAKLKHQLEQALHSHLNSQQKQDSAFQKEAWVLKAHTMVVSMLVPLEKIINTEIQYIAELNAHVVIDKNLIEKRICQCCLRNDQDFSSVVRRYINQHLPETDIYEQLIQRCHGSTQEYMNAMHQAVPKLTRQLKGLFAFLLDKKVFSFSKRELYKLCRGVMAANSFCANDIFNLIGQPQTQSRKTGGMVQMCVTSLFTQFSGPAPKQTRLKRSSRVVKNLNSLVWFCKDTPELETKQSVFTLLNTSRVEVLLNELAGIFSSALSGCGPSVAGQPATGEEVCSSLLEQIVATLSTFGSCSASVFYMIRQLNFGNGYILAPNNLTPEKKLKSVKLLILTLIHQQKEYYAMPKALTELISKENHFFHLVKKMQA
ncbi:hypothetical protein NEDG_01845 [Nematocida displodere]|uniref:Uncharacterized protein n=1 Tax=Nematocida displodere TaxID=1805483 RepID=A0A177EHE4_9MICR|nr:hypothetical protein NEDG_01845 [Nematocida displodere]